jgi:dTDP-4-dehydro-6-deoxy-alpha-D-glucopyranose 2,3-dehydratase
MILMSIKDKQTEIAFFKSALFKDSEVTPTSTILAWIRRKNDEVQARIAQIPLNGLQQWKVDDATGNIVHTSGRFFSIEGIHVETNWGRVASWDQPIINQPEIGFLGILAKKMNGVLHFLMQAKIEPGNLNVVQLSPTLQATKSNYTQVHKGKRPLFLEYFNGEKNVQILLDQLQSEQGARFLRKRNRNIIIEVDDSETIDVPDNFIWVTLGQLKQLIKIDNIVNMDSRTVISGIPFGSYGTDTLQYFSALCSSNRLDENILSSLLNNELYLNDLRKIISWITNLKSRYDLSVKNVPLNKISRWAFDGSSIKHESNKYFSVIGVHVEIGNREVVSWDQPMIQPAQEGIIAFLVKPINGVYHFLIQAKLEAGNFDIIEFAPTVQCLTGNYRVGQNEYSVPFIDEVLNAPQSAIWYSAMQSEEGGRFYKEQNRNMIIEVQNDFPTALPDNYCWMTLNQLSIFIMFNNYLNMAARSLISAVSF